MEKMDEGIFQSFDEAEDEYTQEAEEYDMDYKPSVRWDTALGDFARDSSGRLVQCDGREAYLLWCYKAVQTERDSCLAYMEEISGADLGVEMEGIPQEEDHETAESILERTITEALEVNPRTESVGNFVFTWDGDDVHCQFEVQGVNWDETITIKF